MKHTLPWLHPERVALLDQALAARILVIDGAMGTMIQRHELGEADYRGQRFEDVEDSLERNWDATKANSRLAWNEAKGAVRDGWHHIERAMPGDADGDGR